MDICYKYMLAVPVVYTHWSEVLNNKTHMKLR